MRLRYTKAFTIAELLVAVAIIGTLTAVSIPIFSAQTKKAKAAADMANVRAAKSAAVAAYLSSGESGSISYYYDAASGTVKNEDESGTIAGYGKSADDLSNDGADYAPCDSSGKPRIVEVTVDSDGMVTAKWTLDNDPGTFLALAEQIESSYGNQYHSGNDLISASMDKNGSLPSVSTSDLFGNAAIYNGSLTLYWRPNTATVQGTKIVYLYANSQQTGNANWKGYAIYYNGSTYISTSITRGKIDENSVNINSKTLAQYDSFESYLLANNWKKK